MSLTVDLYWSFRSPYSYFITGRMARLAAGYDVEVVARPVYPIALRHLDFIADMMPQAGAYFMCDIERVAQYLGLPLVYPDPDPVAFDGDTGRAAAEQPYIHRLTRLGAEAALRGHGLAFMDEISQLVWGGRVAHWNEGGHLAEATAKAGLDLAEMDAAIDAEPEKYDTALAANAEAMEAAGHWGVPLCAFDGEPFYGQDRFELLVWRLEQKGMRKWQG